MSTQCNVRMYAAHAVEILLYLFASRFVIILPECISEILFVCQEVKLNVWHESNELIKTKCFAVSKLVFNLHIFCMLRFSV